MRILRGQICKELIQYDGICRISQVLWTKYPSRNFLNEELQIVNKKGKIVSLINHRKTQVKTIMRHYHTSFRMSITKRLNVGEDIQEKKLQRI